MSGSQLRAFVVCSRYQARSRIERVSDTGCCDRLSLDRLSAGARRDWQSKAIGAVVGVNSGRRGRSLDPASPQALRWGFGGAAGRRYDRMEGRPTIWCFWLAQIGLGADKISAFLAR
jgi:hypothetical protein